MSHRGAPRGIESRIWQTPLSGSNRTTSVFCLLKPILSILVIDKKNRTQKRMFPQKQLRDSAQSSGHVLPSVGGGYQ